MKIEPMQHILTTAGAMGTGAMPDDKGMADIFANAKKRIEEALAREHVVLDEAVAKNDNYFLRLLEFAESNEHCTFHCPGRTHCDSSIKGYTARMDAHGYISYCKCKAGDTYWDIFSPSQTKASHIPALYRQMTLANYKETEDNKKALRYAEHKPFIITSNLRLEDIEAGGGVQGQRICSRIAGHCHVLELGGADRRVTPLF